MKSLRQKLNAEVEVISVPNGAYRPFLETLSAVIEHMVRHCNSTLCARAYIHRLLLHVPEGVDRITVKISGDGAKFSSSSHFLLSFSLPGMCENVLQVMYSYLLYTSL